MKLFKMFKRGQKGFTLVELMVVMGIMAILAAIVVPAVTGTKGPAESTGLKGDANAVQQAASKYNNDTTVVGTWPETAIATAYGATDSTYILTAAKATNPGAVDADFTAVSWNATTTIRMGTGALLPVKFVPDFVPSTPKSDGAMSGNSHVYVWLFRKGALTDAQTRTLEVYKLGDNVTSYTKIN